MVVIFGGLGLWTGNILTLMGGGVFGFVLTILALFYRYRHWQVVNKRLFETRVPLRDWFRDELTR